MLAFVPGGSDLKKNVKSPRDGKLSMDRIQAHASLIIECI